MKKLISKNALTTLVALSCLSAGSSAFADGSAGISNMLNFVFGTRQGLLDAASCTLTTRESAISPGWGAIGKVMEILCDAKAIGVTTIPGSGTGTIQGQMGSGSRPTLKIHVELKNAGYTYNGVAYDNLVQVHMCNTSGSACTATSSFSPLAVLFYTHKSDGTNKGFFVIDNSLFEGRTAQTDPIEVTYDFGSDPGKITIRSIMRRGPNNISIRAEGYKYSSGDLSAAVSSVDPTGGTHERFTIYLAKSTLTGGVVYETDRSGVSGTGVATPTLTASTDAPSASKCLPLTWTEVATGGEDRTYTVGSGSCTVTLPKNTADSLNTVAAYSAATISAPLNDTTVIPVNPTF